MKEAYEILIWWHIACNVDFKSTGCKYTLLLYSGVGGGGGKVKAVHSQSIHLWSVFSMALVRYRALLINVS